MRDLCIGNMFDPRTIEARGLRIGRNGSTLLDVGHLLLGGPGPTLILGPNGAGKSLLLRCLHGLIEADAGTVTQGDRVLNDRIRAGQAMVFQRPVLLRRSVAANLDFVLKRQGLGRGDRKAATLRLLREGRLDAKARQPARSLSGGEAQKLAVLRALASEPDILFLDEPTSALDPAATYAIEALIARAGARGTRVIMVTHDIGQARRLGHDIVLMHGGRVVEHGLADRFFEAPVTRIARQFLAGELVL